METFLRRLKFYGIGFGIGLIFVIFFFKNRGCSWLPDNRVKNSILERVLVIPETQAAELKKKGFQQKEIIAFLNDGEVNFGGSIKSQPDRVYLIEKEGKELYFSLPEDSFISGVYSEKPDLSKIRKGKGKAIRFPNEEHFFYADTTDMVECKLNELGLKNADSLYSIAKQNLILDYDQSVFNKVVKPVHRILLISEQKDTIACDATWYKNKVNVTNIYSSKLKNCQ